MKLLILQHPHFQGLEKREIFQQFPILMVLKIPTLGFPKVLIVDGLSNLGVNCATKAPIASETH
jgi:hypothetical protein